MRVPGRTCMKRTAEKKARANRVSTIGIVLA